MRAGQEDLLEEINRVGEGSYEIEKIPAIELSKYAISDFDDMVSRPLFIEGRRPVEESEADLEVASVFSGKFDWELIGVYTSENGMNALFQHKTARNKKDRFSKVYINDDLDGWRIEEIHDDRVVVSHQDNSMEIKLHKPRPVVKAAPAPPPASDRKKRDNGKEKLGQTK